MEKTELEEMKTLNKEVKLINEMTLVFDALSENEGFARIAVGGFIAGANPTIEEISDVKTAVSEAVTNAIIHGYRINRAEREKEEHPKIWIRCKLEGKELTISIEDVGRGIEDVQRAMQPLFTTRPELERSGMGFAFMEAFMDEIEVESALGKGTKVIMKKIFGKENK